MTSMNASDFKAKCLAILDQVERSGEGVAILKRGRPVAQVLPFVPRQKGHPQETLFGTVEILGDVVSPALPAGAWKANRRRA